MKFCIQDPSYENSKCLHEILLTECVDSYEGAGMYAFATKDGVELFLEDESFKKFIQKGKFLLIVGMDDITNVRSIEVLRELKRKYGKNLEVKAYIHNNRKSTFHPKLSWFKKDKGGVLILGSGNLTQQGLRQNREAYTVTHCEEDNFRAMLAEWKQWLEHSKSFLFDIFEEIVLEKAKQNVSKLNVIYQAEKASSSRDRVVAYSALVELYKMQPKDKLFKTVEAKTDQTSKLEKENGQVPAVVEYTIDNEIDVDLEYWIPELDNEVLLAEIPKNGGRLSQVNFDKKSFEDFFGAKCGENGVYRILFRNVQADGTLAKIEVRQSVSVESHNYRFELDAVKGVKYPDGNKRPIGVFVKISQRDFLYELVLPDSQAYPQLIEIMDDKQEASNSMRRLCFWCSEIYKKTANLAIWKRLDVENND